MGAKIKQFFLIFAMFHLKTCDMRTAIIGYGKMGREIETILKERGHEVVAIVDAGTPFELNGADVALEFTTPDTAFENVKRCIDAGAAVVSGTTGWSQRLEEAADYCRTHDGAMFYASNYSLGVNIMFRINKLLAQMMERVGGFTPSIEEVHHTQKKDAPSGTAITLAEGIVESGIAKPEIESIREGMLPGIHTVTWDAPDEVLTLRHEIKNRRVLALGAVVAAEFLYGRKGVYSMENLLR